jgi:hypothetical protein
MIDRFVLLIGAMKAGTTTLFELLAQHPAIAPCREKEPEFLSDPLRWKRGLAAYSKLWEWRPERHVWALEASTKYTKLPAFPSGAIATSRLPATFRFVYLVRHPIDRIRSEYLHSLAKGWIDEPIERGVAPYAVLHSNYRFQLLPYVVAHGREPILVVTYDELLRAPFELARRIWKWLDLDATVPLAEVGRANEGGRFREVLLKMLTAVHGGDVRAAELQLERSITPDAAQIAAIRQLLEPDAALFRDEWGIDAWSLASRIVAQ